ncbi:glycoprotein endo-alpha-1,2-mannosidase-like [Acanthaster planci]|uniref:Glycoprotein endo-alpha-1,2-mannosidase-like n=1 Tax=Acanthaster planci TaxID=133434 RepID=A0A8B7ZCW6_ACAPL|nr:glycoprotein endo-alpha-1,2-mannosidase-like [Acanthaster planci]XP_022103517.1 glycoprotein endo-alpha-1,2-mannosidase-like [Acanthaster planci]XP_022103518.1 glycoprotein endo-alpha-1,2-mannosidase-like [Acanthaster planci]XP_022103519.1 glycoprotein endo-alpha-1,2-mannosidase-like [Acanthaster planci]XP_022103520.1 glycoprotein endo-alpha-1,2-mannosidase-like [Acanthaster planci]
MLTRRTVCSLRFISVCIIIAFIIGCYFALRSITKEESRKDDDFKRQQALHRESIQKLLKLKAAENRHNQSLKRVPTNPPIPNPKNLIVNNAGNRPLRSRYNVSTFPQPNYNVHAFYYPWYGNPQFDGKYHHWNHPRLPHWDKKIAKKFSTEEHVPPDDIGASFYPELGCYSSRDPSVIEIHMQQLRTAGIGVLVLSWYPPSKSDNNGIPSDDLVPILLDACHKYDIKLAFHSEPYKNRSELTFVEDLKYIIDTYGNHPAFYRYKHKGKDLPLVYLYDSYLTSSRAWGRVFKKNSPLSIRETKYDAVIIGLYVEQKHSNDLLVGGFDGFYTYFAAKKFTFGSRWTNWKFLAQFARRNAMFFIPSVGPGYDDVKVRPWNGVNTHLRQNGEYYKESFTAAMNQTPPVISITSFNEWHEGTQIESAVPKPSRNLRYFDYLPNDPDYYLTLTRQMVEKFTSRQGKSEHD